MLHFDLHFTLNVLVFLHQVVLAFAAGNDVAQGVAVAVLQGQIAQALPFFGRDFYHRARLGFLDLLALRRARQMLDLAIFEQAVLKFGGIGMRPLLLLKVGLFAQG